jgi:hypothetical protein
MIIGQSPIKPFAPTMPTQGRWDHTALRRRMIIGAWADDLESELQRHLPPDRREAWGPSDLSSNPFEQITRQLAVLYSENPSVTNANGDITDLLSREGLATQAGLWPLMQRVQQMVIGLREAFVRIDVVPHTQGAQSRAPGLRYRLVTPDFVYTEADPDEPDVPIYYQELRLRQNPDTKDLEWVYDILDIRDPSNPIFGMFLAGKDGSIGADVSVTYMGHDTHKGSGYPYFDSQGNPFLPVVLYHAEKTGHLFDPFFGSQMVYGSLTSAVLFTMWIHLVRDACWSQKYVAGLSVAGLSAVDQDGIARRSSISTDPASILVFTQDPEAQGQPLVGTFATPTDPHSLLESIAKYEYRVAAAAGISPADLTRTSGDPRSGYSLSISKAGQREAQKKYAPTFRMGDEELLAKSAILSNRFLGTSLPESGYRVSYHSIPLSPEEMRAQREDLIQKMGAGLMSPVQAIMSMYDDMDEREAIDYLIKVRSERAQYT